MGLSGLNCRVNNKIITLAAPSPPAAHTPVVHVLFLKQQTNSVCTQVSAVSLSLCKIKISQNSMNQPGGGDFSGVQGAQAAHMVWVSLPPGLKEDLRLLLTNSGHSLTSYFG